MDKHPSITATHPGEILREDIIPEMNVTKTALAKALNTSRQTLYDILNERKPVTAEMAVKLGKVFGNKPAFWLNLQSKYDLERATKSVDMSCVTSLASVA